MLQQILGSKILGRGRFLSLREIAFRDDRGRERLWESVDRSGNGSAAFVLARIVPDDQFLFVRQFRPPVGRLMLEFPAGLIDPGETPEQTAVRELYEETGFSGRVLAVSRPGFSSPGLTGEAITMVTMEIDGDACRGRKIAPHPEDSESIEVFRVDRRRLSGFVAEQEAAGVGINTKIYAFLAGLALAAPSA